MTDLSFNIVALDKTTATLMKVAEHLDRVAAKIDKLDGKKATVDVNVKTDKANASIDLLDTKFKKMTAGVIAAAPLAGGAVIGGLGAAFVGIAALAEKSNAEVQASYKTLWADVVAETKAGANQVVPQLVASGQLLDAEMQDLGPQIKQAFSAAGPDIIAMSQGVADFAHNIMPGATEAMQQSLPVFVGVETAAGRLGQAGGNALQSMSQHAQAYGRDIQSAGAVADGALTGAVGVVNALGETWAQNADSIDSSVTSLGGSISGVATGAVPALSDGLGVVADTAKVVTGVLEPLAPLLGSVGGYALVAWAAFKGAAIVATGVRALGTGVADLGVKMEATAAKSAIAGASVKSFAASTATAATGVGVAAASIAGPLGIALVGGITLWEMFGAAEESATRANESLRQTTDDLTSALVGSKGAVNDQVVSTLKSEQSFKTAAQGAHYFGISQQEIIDAVTKGGPALDEMRKKLENLVKINTGHFTGGGDYLTPAGIAAKASLDSLNQLSAALPAATAEQRKMADQARNASVTVLASANSQTMAAAAAHALGLGLSDANLGFLSVIDSGKAAADNMGDVVEQTFRANYSIVEAGQTITDHFEQADKAVTLARSSVADANHAIAQSSRSVADAMHSEAQAARAVQQAQQGVQDAQHGVATAQEALVRAQNDERTAQAALHTARQQALQDLKDLREEVEGQAITEQQAQLRLFDAQQAAAKLGIKTPKDVTDLASAKVTAKNEDQIRAALELLSAQDNLADAKARNKELQGQLTAAEKAGVEGSKVYKDAQANLASAHKQTQDAAYSLAQAQRNLQRAEQQVTDAAYQQQRAHQAVRDAQYQQAQSAKRLSEAQAQLRQAETDATRSLDQSTEAGRNNLKMVFDLWDAINATGLPAQEKYKRLIDGVAKSFGMTRQAAQAYLVQIGRIPKDYKYSITAVADVDEISYQNLFKKAFVARDFGGKFATGGPIVGPGGPRDDKILLWGSDGEYMQPADSVAHYGLGFMEAIRKKQLPKFADGGLLGLGLGLQGASYHVDVTARNVMGIKHPPQLPKYAPPPTVASPGSPAGPVSGIPSSVASNRATVLSVFASTFGWKGASEVNATDFLLMHESGYRNTAQNPHSTAYGMFQFLDSTWGGYGIPKTSDPRLQAVAGGRYIKARYGDPIGAQRFWAANHWYDQGGYLMPGAGMYTNATGLPEMVLPPEMTKLTEDFARMLYGGRSGSLVRPAGGSTSPTVVVVPQQQVATQGMFVGELYLDNGTLVGIVRGAIRQEMEGQAGQI